ncbi:MAG: ShlB/FhaC/HecB family hemolysin secretion/activation protein [Nitrosomonas sp.]|uniref:ShlB/FhaC/HecB family hemolysin secretion/activation protein n=1 Tax=Nitrosomonas sp. TaxID=42353 RepID=UPI0032ED57BD
MKSLRLQMAICWVLFASTASGQNLINPASSLRPSENPLSLESMPASPGIAIPEKLESKPSAQEQKDQTLGAIELDTVLFEGNTVFSIKELNALAKPYLHRLVGVDELEELRRSITYYYINKGYITSGATFPPNPIEGKTLRIRIVEGKVGEMRIDGQGWLRRGYIENRLIPDKNSPLNMNVLQDRFRLLLADPLFERLNGRLLPGADRGASILDLAVTRSQPYQLSAISDNYRAPSVGGIALGANAWIRNLTKQGDLIDFTFLTSAPSGGDAYQYSGNWLVPIGDYGTRAYFSASNSNVSIIEESLVNINIKSNSLTVEGGINQLLIDNFQRRLSFGAGISIKDNETSLLGHSFSFIPGLPNGKSQISAVRINQEYIERWEKFAWALRSTFSIGIDALGSTIQKNHLNPDSEYFAWLGQSRGVWNVPQIKSDFVFKGAVQVSDDPLLPLERMAVGGRNTVRGYRENQLVRDNGYAASTELHIHLVGDSQTKYRFDLVPFFDFGAAWNNHDSTPIQQTMRHIYSAGIGFQFRMYRFNSEFFWAHRLESQSPQQHGDLQDQGIHFQARLDAF